MSERGVFAVDRGIWDHPLLQDSGRDLSRREAWIWMISEAAWKPHRVKRSGRMIEIGRGEFAHSTRFMASAWMWSEAKVRRFLACLKTDAMIDARCDAGITHITICNYNEYQRVSLPSDAVSDAASDAGATQERRKLEDKEYKEEESSSLFEGDTRARDDGDDWPPDYREQFWERYPNKVGKLAALSALDRVRKRRLVLWETLIAGLSAYIRKVDDRPWCNPSTWLNQGRWDDQHEEATIRAPPNKVRSGGFAALVEKRLAERSQHEQSNFSGENIIDLTAGRR